MPGPGPETPRSSGDPGTLPQNIENQASGLETLSVSARGRLRSHGTCPEHPDSASVLQPPERSVGRFDLDSAASRTISRSMGKSWSDGCGNRDPVRPVRTQDGFGRTRRCIWRHEAKCPEKRGMSLPEPPKSPIPRPESAESCRIGSRPGTLDEKVSIRRAVPAIASGSDRRCGHGQGAPPAGARSLHRRRYTEASGFL